MIELKILKKIIILIKLILLDTLKQSIFIFTFLLPQGIISITIRGFLLRVFLKKAGTNFTVDSGVTLSHSYNIEVGNNVYLAKNVWINAGGGLIVGDNVKIGPMTIISTGQHVFLNHKLLNESIRKKVEIGSDTWIAGNVTITDGIKIGSGVLVGAGSVVTKDIPDNSIVVGVPARVIGITK